MDSIVYILSFVCLGLVLSWYIGNENAGADGTRGLLALTPDEPTDAKDGQSQGLIRNKTGRYAQSPGASGLNRMSTLSDINQARGQNKSRVMGRVMGKVEARSKAASRSANDPHPHLTTAKERYQVRATTLQPKAAHKLDSASSGAVHNGGPHFNKAFRNRPGRRPERGIISVDAGERRYQYKQSLSDQLAQPPRSKQQESVIEDDANTGASYRVSSRARFTSRHDR
ncbi:MAG: hypothetical protein AAF720_03335 [Pseudomonadota bacterium]